MFSIELELFVNKPENYRFINSSKPQDPTLKKSEKTNQSENYKSFLLARFILDKKIKLNSFSCCKTKKMTTSSKATSSLILLGRSLMTKQANVALSKQFVAPSMPAVMQTYSRSFQVAFYFYSLVHLLYTKIIDWMEKGYLALLHCFGGKQTLKYSVFNSPSKFGYWWCGDVTFHWWHNFEVVTRIAFLLF